MVTSENGPLQMDKLQKRWVSNHQRNDIATMEQCGKRQNLNDEVTSRFVNGEIRSINGNKRKLFFAKDRTRKTMGQQPSNNGFCHHETIYTESKPQK